MQLAPLAAEVCDTIPNSIQSAYLPNRLSTLVPFVFEVHIGKARTACRVIARTRIQLNLLFSLDRACVHVVFGILQLLTRAVLHPLRLEHRHHVTTRTRRAVQCQVHQTAAT